MRLDAIVSLLFIDDYLICHVYIDIIIDFISWVGYSLFDDCNVDCRMFIDWSFPRYHFEMFILKF